MFLVRIRRCGTIALQAAGVLPLTGTLYAGQGWMRVALHIDIGLMVGLGAWYTFLWWRETRRQR
jgi:hypothetical protein